MALKKIKLGDLIQPIDERNSLGIKNFYGVNINKEFMPTFANTDGLDESKYKVIRNERFVFSGMQTGRDNCIRISMYDKETPIIVSPAYATFEVSNSILPTWLFMYFLSKEKDRLGAFYSDGSVRTNLDWDRFCDIEIDLPDLATQQKYVDIYNAMKANQKAYERGLEDLKLVCDGYIDKIKYTQRTKLENLIERRMERNSDFKVEKLIGVGKDGFIEPKQDKDETNGHICYLIREGDFVFAPPQIHSGSLDYYEKGEILKCSDAYIVFYIKDKRKLEARYLKMILKNRNLQRRMWFYRDGVREQFNFEQLSEMDLPIPPMQIQESIANIYKCYEQRKEINEQLKAKIREMCPILIKGSIDEARGK